MDDPNITMEEYIKLEEEKAHRRGKLYVFNDTLTSEAALSCKPTVSSLNNDEIDFRISFDESDDEDCTEDTTFCTYTHQRPRRKQEQYAISREDQYAILKI
nr:hypothetical protein [Tanacetum cinerariifolium]